MSSLTERVSDVLCRIRYHNRASFAVRDRKGTVLMRHQQLVTCVKTGEQTLQGGRWFFISPHMTDEEILRTAFLAVHLFQSHEVNEHFKVSGTKFLNPHPEGGREDWWERQDD